MSDSKLTQMDRIMRYADLIQKQTGKAVRPFRADGYVNLMNRYGTSKDPAEHYHFEREPDIPDDVLTMVYEGNGLFAKIIDTPAEEAIKHGFTLKDVSDQNVEDFYVEALDELDWEEIAMTAIRWARLFGGSIAVMLINDGGRLEDPLNWRNIKSIDDIRVYERAIVQPDYQSMYSYDPSDPFRTRGSRLGMPEFYQVTSRYGNFTVHDSRCLVFQNGILPENATNSLYQLWGIPEYVRIRRALKDAELAHESAPKLLDRSVQAIYKMQGLSSLLATEQGENQVLRRLQVIDMARGMLNSLVIDADGEDYDFKTFQFNGITDVVSASCNMLSAITSIPQTILFGQGVGGMSSTDDTSMENYYNYVERIQKRMLRSNLRYLLSIIFQAGLYTGEVDEVPKINVEFNPLWSLTDSEQADLDQRKAATQLTKAQTVQAYVSMEAIDPSEVRKKLADSDEFDVETMLDEYEDDEDLFSNMQAMEGEAGSQTPAEGQSTEQASAAPAEEGAADYAEEVDVKEHDTDPGKNGSASPAAAPAATKLPQDMSEEEKAEAVKASQNPAQRPGNSVQGDGDTSSSPDDLKAGVGVIVVKDGKILTGTRKTDFGYGLICGPGGHIKVGETPTQAAFRETEEEFGISPKELTPLGRGPAEPDTEIQPYIFLCTDYEGEPNCVDREMADPTFRAMEELEQLRPSMFQPFVDGVDLFKTIINSPDPEDPDPTYPHDDGGEGSGNFNHKGRPGEVGGSAESHQLGGMKNGELASKMKDVFGKAKVGTHFSIQMEGPVGKEAYEAFKTSDGYYLRSKKGSNKIIASDDKLVEGCGVYVVEATKNRTMYKKADIQIGEPETDEAKKFAEDYASFQKAKERLQAGETQISEVSDDVAKQYADTLNKASKGKIAKIAAEDPQFKAVVDNISAYTQGEYIFQRKTVEGVVENGYDPSKDAILGDRLTDSAFSCKDMYQGQNLSVSSASVAEWMTNLSKAVKCSEPYEGELYRVAQDRSILFEQDSGRQGVYVPPTVGETIKITAPTSFSKDRAAVDKIAKDKMGDIIYYTVEPGAHAVDVSKLSPYKQAELLSCGDYEVVKVESEPRTALWDREDKFTSETLEALQKHRGATISEGYVTYPVLTTRIILRQKETGNTDSADDDTRCYRPDDFCDRMILDGGPGSGNFGHEGRPGEIGGSAPDGSADSKKSTEKTAKLKEGFKHLKPNQKYAYISRSGIVPKGELESLKEGIRTGDQASMDKLAEYEQMYFDSAEYGRTVKTLNVEMRDEVAAMSDADAAAWAQKSMDRQLESHEGWANQYSAAQKVAIDMAVCETPQVVSREDFDKYVKDSGAVVCYRGVKDIDSMTGENMQFQMAYNTQEPYFGDGIFGDGLYFSTRKDTAESYAGRAEISTCAVRPDAKILEYGSPEHDKAKKRVQTTDDSVAALCSGYDVIHKKQGSDEDYYVILNRAALVMVDPVDDLADVALKTSERNAARGDEKTVDSEEKTLDFSTSANTIKSKGTSEDGGPGSGNHGHKGVPGQVGGSLPATTTEALKEAIATGSISTKLSRFKQSKHKKGTAKYNNAIAKGNYVSYMTVDDDEIESIVKTKAGTGKPYGGGQHFKETVDAGKPVGVYLNERGEEKETTRVTIHYGSKDCHVVPASPKKG